jgi:hypothetical protein
VYYIPDLYYKEKDMMKEYLPKHGLPVDLHAGTDDTSEVLYVDKMVNGESSKWIRPGKLVNAREGDGTGVDGDQTRGTVDLGKMFTDAKVSFAVHQIFNVESEASSQENPCKRRGGQRNCSQ